MEVLGRRGLWGSDRAGSIMAVVMATGNKEPGYACIVDGDGEPSNHIAITMPKRNDNSLLNRLYEFWRRHGDDPDVDEQRPHLVVFAAGPNERMPMNLKRFVGDFAEKVKLHIQNERSSGNAGGRGGRGGRDDDDDVDDMDLEGGSRKGSGKGSGASAGKPCAVTFAEDTLALAFASSKVGADEMPEQNQRLRAAVGLARGLWDPLLEHCALWNPTLSGGRQANPLTSVVGRFNGNIIFNTPENMPFARRAYHAATQLETSYSKLPNILPLEDTLSPTQLHRVISNCLVHAVNLLGVDLAAAVDKPRRRCLLSHLSGMGPRKAGLFIANATRVRIRSRDDLDRRALLGPMVYRNVVGFLRFDGSNASASAAANNDFNDELDDYGGGAGGAGGKLAANSNLALLGRTRIHPDDYSTTIESL